MKRSKMLTSVLNTAAHRYACESPACQAVYANLRERVGAAFVEWWSKYSTMSESIRVCAQLGIITLLMDNALTYAEGDAEEEKAIFRIFAEKFRHVMPSPSDKTFFLDEAEEGRNDDTRRKNSA